MIISVEYKNGRIKEFDPSTFTTSQALPQQSAGSRSVMTEFDLRVDDVENRGLCLDLWWYDITDVANEVPLADVVTRDGEEVRLGVAGRQLGCSVTLVTAEGMALVSRVVVYRAGGSSTVLWRQGSEGWLINGAKFDAARVLTYTDGNTVSSNLQALKLYNYMRAANPDMDDDAVAESFGYPLEAINEIILNEMAAEEMDREIEASEDAPVFGSGLADAAASGVAEYKGTRFNADTGEVVDDIGGASFNEMEGALDMFDDEEDEDDY